MNEILKPFIRKSVLVFFDDILVVSRLWAEHLQHVKEVFEVLRAQAGVEKIQVPFGEGSVSYLRHVVSINSVAIDQAKVTTVESWPRPRTLKGLRGFLGLTSYYRKCIARYGTVAAPLTALLKKEAFPWSHEAEEAFGTLKQALMMAPLLQMPDFNRRFVVDCDASGAGFGAVLHQGVGSIAFFSRNVVPHQAKLPLYERELIELVKAVQNWRPYLWGRAFTVRMDHYSLKFTLDQRLTTTPQHTLVSKFFGYDLTIQVGQVQRRGRRLVTLGRGDGGVVHPVGSRVPTVQYLTHGAPT